MKNPFRFELLTLILAATGTAFLWLGCTQKNESSLIGPSSHETAAALSHEEEESFEEEDNDVDDDEDGDDDYEFLTVARRDSNENGVTTVWIGPAGGVLVHADHRIVIPAGALSETLPISFSMPVSDTLMFDLGPHGTQFSMPINMVLAFQYDNADLTGVNESLLRVAYYNESTGVWDPMPTQVDPLNDIVVGQTTHFSRYAIIRN